MSAPERTRTPEGEPDSRARRRFRELSQRRRRRLTLTVVGASVVAVVAVGVIVSGIVGRAEASDEFASTAAKYSQLRDGVAVDEIAASVEGVKAALDVQTDLASDEVVAQLSSAGDSAATALAAVKDAVAWDPEAQVAGEGADELTQAAVAVNDHATVLTSTADAAAQQAQALAAARSAFTDDVVARGMTLLGDYSDAERSTEDAFYAALQALPTVAPADFGAAVADAASKAAAVRDSAAQYRAEIAAQATGKQPTGGDVAAQTAYLLEHATNYNVADWGDYNPSGGDCVNFTSQGLLARGWQMDGTWSSKGPGGASTTWVLTSAMERYLRSAGFVAHGADDLDRVRVGDVGIFDWGETAFATDHTMTVSKVEYTPDGPVIYFASHNSDGQYRELQSALYTEHSNSTVRIYSIP